MRQISTTHSSMAASLGALLVVLSLGVSQCDSQEASVRRVVAIDLELSSDTASLLVTPPITVRGWVRELCAWVANDQGWRLGLDSSDGIFRPAVIVREKPLRIEARMSARAEGNVAMDRGGLRRTADRVAVCFRAPRDSVEITGFKLWAEQPVRVSRLTWSSGSPEAPRR
jgi:hypothetical protein